MAHACASSLDSVSLMTIRLQYENNDFEMEKILLKESDMGWNVYELALMHGVGDDLLKYLRENFQKIGLIREEKVRGLFGTRRRFGR